MSTNNSSLIPGHKALVSKTKSSNLNHQSIVMNDQLGGERERGVHYNMFALSFIVLKRVLIHIRIPSRKSDNLYQTE